MIDKQKLVQDRINSSNEDQLKCLTKMWETSLLSICIPTGAGKGHLMMTDILKRIINTDDKLFVVATHRLMLNSQHLSDVIDMCMDLTGEIGYIFVGSLNYSNKTLLNKPKFNGKLYNLRLKIDDLISTVASGSALNEKVKEHISKGRKVVIISTYHSLMKLGALDVDVMYCDEAHLLATNSQKTDILFKENFKLITAENKFFFTATPKDLVGVSKLDDSEIFLMNNKEIFGERIGITFADAVSKGYVVPPIIHLLKPMDLIEGDTSFGSVEDKAKFVIDAFYAHRKYMKDVSSDPDKIGVKILVKCANVVEEMWPLYNMLIEKIPNVMVCAGASVEASEDYDIQGKHYIDGKQIIKRDDYLDGLQAIPSVQEAIVLHCEILSEGINVAGFTAIMFLGGILLTTTKILQNIGRATRLHSIDRLNLKEGKIKVNGALNTWVKPCCSVIIPCWDDISNFTQKQVARIIYDLRTIYDFDPALLVNLGDDKAMKKDEDDEMKSLVEQELDLRDSLVEEIEQEIEGIKLGNVEREELIKVKKLTTPEYFYELVEDW